MAGLIEPLDERDRGDVEGGQGLDRDLGIGDVGGCKDDSAAGSVSVEQVVEAGDVEVSVEHSLGRDGGQDGEVDVVSGGFGDDLGRVAVELGGGVFRMDALEVVADADASAFEEREGEGGGGLGDGVEVVAGEESGEPGEGGQGVGGRHGSMFSRSEEVAELVPLVWGFAEGGLEGGEQWGVWVVGEVEVGSEAEGVALTGCGEGDEFGVGCAGDSVDLVGDPDFTAEEGFGGGLFVRARRAVEEDGGGSVVVEVGNDLTQAARRPMRGSCRGGLADPGWLG